MNIKNFTNNGTVNEVYDSVVAISPQGQQIQQNNVDQPKPEYQALNEVKFLPGYKGSL